MNNGSEHPTLKRFTYWDNSKRVNGELLLSTVASTIAFADAELLKKKGFDVMRCPWIGCEVGAFLSVPYSPPKTQTRKDYGILLDEEIHRQKLGISHPIKRSEVEVLTPYVKSGCVKPCDSIRTSVGLKPKKKKKSKVRLSALHDKQFGECYYCWNPTRLEDFTVDHVLAVSKGGDDSPENLVGACRECNKYKGNLPVEIFEASDYLRRKRESVEIPK